MAEKFRVQSLIDGAWKTQSIFSDQNSYGDARIAADQLIASDEYSEVRILEAYKKEPSEEPAYRVVFSSKFPAAENASKRPSIEQSPPPDPETYEIRNGLTGKWVHIGKREAKRHPLYGVGGWLFFFSFGLTASLISNLLHYLTNMPPTPESKDLLALALIVAVHALPLFLLIKKNRFFQPVTISIMTVLTLLASIAIRSYGDLFPIGLSLMWIGYLAVSERVNVTMKNRVRPAYLEKVRDQGYPVPQSIVNSSDW